MNGDLDRLSEAYGIALFYISETGEERYPSEAAKRRLLGALGVPSSDDAEVQQSLAALEQPRCYIPDWLEGGRVWGITCQLYGIRSRRNWGMGDFEDLVRFAEVAAAAGADFVGVNPLHSLFMAEPLRFSPYSPSSRRFLNPLYIAVDQLGIAEPDREALDDVRDAELVDYPAVARLKRAALETAFANFRTLQLSVGSPDGAEFDAYCRQAGRALEDFALFEAISEEMVRQDFSCGWHGWPEEFRDRKSEEVEDFHERHGERVLFHMWLQWVAHEQLAAAQERALAAGMRIGLYLDLAVGVAPDGADSWGEPDSVLRGVRVGSPPDAFNAKGQDWGLAPISPVALRSESGRIFREIIAAALQSAGAVRIDHVMALSRLYLIADGLESSEGAYVGYPFRQLLDTVAAVSQDTRALIIGEDLGTVPPNFRETMRDSRILGYRVLFFERGHDGRFRPPHEYEREAMACTSTHDLPTLRGWWGGYDLDDREAIGMDDAASSAERRAERASERQLMIDVLAEADLLADNLRAASQGDLASHAEWPEEVTVAISRFLARTPCRLVALQLEDLTAMRDRANLPGTTDEHPNWRRKLPVLLEDVAQMPLFVAVTQAVSDERPR